MFVTSAFGPDRGCLVEVDMEAGRAMLLDGRAVTAFAPQPPASGFTPSNEVAKPEAVGPEVEAPQNGKKPKPHHRTRG